MTCVSVLLYRKTAAALKHIVLLRRRCLSALDSLKLTDILQAAGALCSRGIDELDFKENPCLVRRRVEFINR